MCILPQRSEFAVKIYAKDMPEKEVWKLEGHKDVVREFLWRTKGGHNSDDGSLKSRLQTCGES